MSGSGCQAEAGLVVLFDIDGTLLRGPLGRRSAGFRAMHRALADLLDPPGPLAAVDFAGRTDAAIARLLLEAAGRSRPEPELIRTMLDLYLARLQEFIVHDPYQALGEPAAAIDGLRDLGAVIGLGTGNLRNGARAKLASAGLLDLFNLELGGYADDAELRSELIEAGARRCDPGRLLPLVVVGDTVHDVLAARACGAFCVAVPFGDQRGPDLLAAGADRLVEQVDHRLPEVITELLAEAGAAARSC